MIYNESVSPLVGSRLEMSISVATDVLSVVINRKADRKDNEKDIF